MPRLTLLKGKATWKTKELDELPVLIGRDQSKGCNVLLSDNRVSRKHAEIAKGDQGGYLIFDRESNNGTSLNGMRLGANAGHCLNDRDLIQICGYVLRFDGDDSSAGSKRIRVDLADDTSDGSGSSGYSSILDSASSSWRTRQAFNSEAKLAAVMELTERFRTTLSLNSIREVLLDGLLEIFPQSDRAIVALGSESDAQEFTITGKARYKMPAEQFEVNQSMVATSFERREAIISENQSCMCVPLIARGDKTLGVVVLETVGPHDRFTPDDLDLMATVAVQVSFVIENSRLHETALQERAVQHELQVAQEVQIGLLPDTPPDVAGYDFFDHYSSAKHVGGDYFDYLDLNDQRLAFALGDVSGKGLPAALLMAKVSSELSILLETGLSPVEAIGRVNARFEQRSPEGSFVTLVLAVLDFETNQIAVVNAGHMRPLLRHASGEITEIGGEDAGLPLGVDRDFEFRESSVTLHSGECLLLFSDGVTDAQNANGKYYKTRRLRDCLKAACGSASVVGKCIIDDVYDFIGDRQQFDDICLLCVSRSS